MRFGYYKIDNSERLYKASALYKVLDNRDNFLCNLTNLKEARRRSKNCNGKIYKILQNEFMETIFSDLWEDYSKWQKT